MIKAAVGFSSDAGGGADGGQVIVSVTSFGEDGSGGRRAVPSSPGRLQRASDTVVLDTGWFWHDVLVSDESGSTFHTLIVRIGIQAHFTSRASSGAR